MIKLVKNLEEANAITHAGSFHADDVFATIFLSKLQDISLIRVNEIKETDKIDEKIVYDIGFGEFDHHGENAKVRENGIKYSAFGLLFEKFGKEYLKQKRKENVEECYQAYLKEFVLQIDAIDNGIFPKNPKDYSILTLSGLIECFNKTWKEECSTDEAFLEAIKIGEIIFNRIEKRILDKLDAKVFVEKGIENSKDSILILEEYMPFMDFILTSRNEKAKEILFVIYPSNRGGYGIRTVNKELGNHENRMDFPEKWAGKSAEELIEMTGINTFHFCHVNRFLCSCDTLEDAISVSKQAIKEK